MISDSPRRPLTKTARWLLVEVANASPYEVRSGLVNQAVDLVNFGLLRSAAAAGNWVECTPEGEKRADLIRRANARRADRTERGGLPTDENLLKLSDTAIALLVRAHRVGKDGAAETMERETGAAIALGVLGGRGLAWTAPGPAHAAIRYQLTEKGRAWAARLSELRAQAAHKALSSPLLAGRLAGAKAELSRAAWPAYAGDARACPACKCTPDAACTVTLDEDAGVANCLPAGVFGFERCSACEARA